MKHVSENSHIAMKSKLLFIFALSLLLATFAVADEITPEKFEARKAETERQKLDPLFDKLQGLESTLSEANVVTEAAAPKNIVSAAAELAKPEVAPAPVSVPESRPSTGAWGSVVPMKDTSAGVGEVSGDVRPANQNPNTQNLMNQASTSTLSLSDLGNAKKVMGALEDMTLKRNAMDKSMATMNGVVAQARNLGQPGPGKEKPPEKKERSGSQLDPDNNSTKSKFGDTNDLTLGNIAKNNDAADKAQSIKDMMDKALANKDKNKEKEAEKKKAEKQKLEKELGEIVERDPFKFEDYEALRDMFNDKADMAQEILAQNPKLKELKDKIVDEFAPRDAAPASKKEPLLNFLADKDLGEKFQSPINVDPTSPRNQVHPAHSGESASRP